MPPMVGMNSHAKSRSPRCRCCITNTGAEAMYKNNAPKLNVPAAANRWKRGLTKIAT